MLIGKESESVVPSNLLIDNWRVDYKDNNETGEVDLVETFEGQIPIKETKEEKYLGFVISSKGDNMANISQVKKEKSIGIIKKTHKPA